MPVLQIQTLLPYEHTLLELQHARSSNTDSITAMALILKPPPPQIDPAFLPQLRSLCPDNGDGLTLMGLDNGSPNTFDTSFYANLRNIRGILASDQM
ncbi:hypothetical protein RHGRI_021106 [Rhododendron griersonianum]|uniref:peroxidase n=1 Tax=Rhododendron griersonianum TaxID=479676 RepID=A0AAV6JKU0_9ERIC|nr:hypothetical protein RHGRI_021106 [Rhododendron griersonianum]